MRLPSFLTRSASSTPAEPASAAPADVVQRARTQARQRLIGASLLLGLGIIGFPLLFETQPRPVPVDIPIEIPSKDAVAALPALPAAPGARRASQPAAASAPLRSVAVAAPTEPAPAAASAAPAASVPAPKPTPKPVAKAEPKPEPKPEAKPEVKPEAKPAPASAPAEGGRFVVQVGAFADATGAREARLKAEKLGLKTYTQAVQVQVQGQVQGQSAQRIRVRLGPFANRQEAERALAKLKAAGLGGAVLTL